MSGHDEQLVRLEAQRRDAFSDAGLPMTYAPLHLRDATLLVPRWRDRMRYVSLHHRDVHVIGRAYARDEMRACHGGNWRTVRTEPGAVTVIPVDFEITYDVPGNNDYSLVILPDSRLQACADELASGHQIQLRERLAVDDPATSRLLELIDREVAHGDRSSTMFVERAIDLLCIELIRGHAPIAAKPRRGLAAWQVRRITSYMREHLAEDISLGELAAIVRLSRFHFCTAFRLATGSRPYEWLLGLRMDRARELLATAIPITEIALLTGYSTPSAFAAAFRRCSGETPTQYRRRMRR